MIVISGQRCLEQFGKFVPDGSWARMFSESLIGRTDWFSNRCALIWKLKGTKYNRLYFQLAVLVRRTKDTAHGLLPTVTVSDGSRGPAKLTNGMSVRKTGMAFNPQLTDLAAAGLLPTVQTQGLKMCDEKGKTAFFPLNLLPTPTVSDATNSSIPPSQVKRDNLARAYLRGSLPTPKANDWRSGMPNRQDSNHSQQLNDTVAYQAGTTSQLNPLFVEEMMGFPTGWILTPFLRGCPKNSVLAEIPLCAVERNPLNATETPLSPK